MTTAEKEVNVSNAIANDLRLMALAKKNAYKKKFENAIHPCEEIAAYTERAVEHARVRVAQP